MLQILLKIHLGCETSGPVNSQLPIWSDESSGLVTEPSTGHLHWEVSGYWDTTHFHCHQHCGIEGQHLGQLNRSWLVISRWQQTKWIQTCFDSGSKFQEMHIFGPDENMSQYTLLQTSFQKHLQENQDFSHQLHLPRAFLEILDIVSLVSLFNTSPLKRPGIPTQLPLKIQPAKMNAKWCASQMENIQGCHGVATGLPREIHLKHVVHQNVHVAEANALSKQKKKTPKR